ncbi:DEKNAAC104690 [Brettanomyces naardenensis]|uniref:Pro-apoptotic serine protease NMA111 n=1 Tax=Brettanomyces naardenensis TaxID=13370 RepID=A0A448YR43_BRENA|nr:DEKNAAC104690 [Brettanomyces naardenensis]
MPLSPQKRSVDNKVGGSHKRQKQDQTAIITNVQSNGSSTATDFSGKFESSLRKIPLASSYNDSQWQDTVEKVVKAVVSIHFMQVEDFDTESAMCSEATGFVVDAKLGLILTNRHVVGPGPFIGYAVFDNHEECEVKPLYRDPVHDFGFLKFDPSEIKYMDITELNLRPDLAKVGCEIRVIGNDSGEKLSILSGFISRLDRNAPDYGPQSYNDFNTEYIQAAASASGGSSGSPVVNMDGDAVALQAGGSTESSTDFFLPVYRVLRAMKCLQSNQPVARGTIQVQWYLEPFDKCRRLGLTPETEKMMRQNFPHINGLLVSAISLPEGPADKLIKEGDCLISINGKLISSFVTVDEILDSNVGNEVKILIQRGGQDMEVTCKVQDLHSITPDRYLSVCGATFNDLSYQLARIYGIPVRGLYVSNAGGSFVLGSPDLTNCWIIDTIDNKETPNLDAFIEVMKQIPDKAFVPVKYHHLTDIHVPLFKYVYIDRHWTKSFKTAKRNDKTGLWDFTTIQKEPVPPLPCTPKHAKFLDLPTEFAACKTLVRSFALVDATYPLPLDSFPGHVRRVYGVIIDAEEGYILTSRHCVSHDLCDINITIAESIIIPGKVVFLHPTKGYAIIKYDPSLVKAPVETPKFGSKPLERGEKVIFIGYNKSLRIVIDETKVSDVGVINIPSNSNAPRYKATNVEAVLIDSTSGQKCGSGVLADKDGTVRAFWLSCDGEEDRMYTMGVNVTDVMWELEFLKNGKLPDLKIIDVEFGSILIATARINGVSEEWIKKIENNSKDKLQFLYVPSVTTNLENNSPCDLKPGDIVLSANDRLITRFRDLDSVIRDLPPDVEQVSFKVVREKKVIDLDVKLTRTANFLTKQVVFWSGCALQEPHHGVRQAISNLPSKVYCTYMSQGSPSKFYTVGITNFITHVNEKPTPTLDEFVKVVREIKDNTYCKLRIVSFDNIPMAQTLKVNYHYFPTVELVKDIPTNKWEFHEITSEEKPKKE